MKTLLLSASIGLLAALPSFSAEEVYAWDSLNSERKLRATVEKLFPDLEFGFYYFNGQWLMGALEDFERGRIFLFMPFEGTGESKLLRNGTTIPLPLARAVTLRIAGARTTSTGSVNDPSLSVDRQIGYWLNLEATDTFSFEANLTYPSKGIFRATYDPDSRWQTSYQWAPSDQNQRPPADVYETSRKPLLYQVLKVLDKQDTCSIRLKDSQTIAFTRVTAQPVQKVSPVLITLTDKISIGDKSNQESLSTVELRDYLSVCKTAAEAAHVILNISINVGGLTSDEVFRACLMELGSNGCTKVTLIQN